MHDQDRYNKLMSLASHTSRLPEAERAGFILQHCPDSPSLAAELRALLEAAESPDSLLRSPPMAGAFADSLHAWNPAVIGGFDIIGRLGQGGAGVVFQARQHHPERTIAIKALRPGLFNAEQGRRFAIESAALAKLEHPGIARVYTTGEDREGSLDYPYIAMELVEGLPITHHAVAAKLSITARIELLIQVCDAVTYAHRRGVIHRDLKPSNILVDHSGQPRILDFGLALSTERSASTDKTQQGLVLGTPPYLSPEQACGRSDSVDTRCDVYALGVLLFELLTRQRPYDVVGLTPAQSIRLVMDHPPARLASVAPALRGDLDAIVSKALARDADRRYQSVAELAADLQRHLDRVPVTARAPSAFYTMSRFVRRRAQLALVISLALGLLLAGGVWHTIRAQRLINASIQTLTGMSWLADSPLFSSEQAPAAFKALEARILQQSSGNQALCGAAWYWAGQEFSRRGDLRRDWARECFTRSDADLSASLGADHPLAQAARAALSMELAAQGQPVEAERILGSLLTHARRSRNSILIAQRLADHGMVLAQLNRNTEARAELDESEKLFSSAGIAESPITLLQTRGEILVSLGDHAGALEVWRSLFQRRVGRSDRAAYMTLLRMAQAELRVTGDLDRVLGYLDEAEAMRPWMHDLRMTNFAAQLRAGVAWASGDFAAAERMFRELLAQSDTWRSPDDRARINSLNGLGNTLRDSGQLSEAEPLLREVLDVYTRTLPPEHSLVASAKLNLAKLLLLAEQPNEALKLGTEAYHLRQSALGPTAAETLEASAVRYLAMARTGSEQEARAGLEADVRRRYDLGLTGEWSTDFCVEALAQVLIQQGFADEASELVQSDYHQALALWGKNGVVSVRAAHRCERYGFGEVPGP